jgi:hypothetical protein
MITGPVEMAHRSRNHTLKRHLFLSFIAMVFTITFSPSKAHAQTSGEIEANIPFQFHAGNTKLPAGKYVIHTLDNADLTLMEISSADGSTSALFEVRQTEADSTPTKTELIFNKYGNRYFLAKLYDEGNPDGSTLDKSSYEKMAGQAAAEAQARVPAHHKGQRGS